jgi:hypothetical protein
MEYAHGQFHSLPHHRGFPFGQEALAILLIEGRKQGRPDDEFGGCAAHFGPARRSSVIASLYIGSVMLLILNLPLAGLRVRSITIPQPLLYGGIQAIQLTHESFARTKRKMATRQTR